LATQFISQLRSVISQQELASASTPPHMNDYPLALFLDRFPEVTVTITCGKCASEIVRCEVVEPRHRTPFDDTTEGRRRAFIAFSELIVDVIELQFVYDEIDDATFRQRRSA